MRTDDRLLLRLLTALMALVVLSACHTTKKTATPTATIVKRTTVEKTIDISSLPDPTQRLVREATSWLGTKYVYGGETRSGVDCSGLVMAVYRDALGINVPRNSAKQQEFCTKIDRRNLSVGDLVFFTSKGGSKVSHVGIYLGDNRLIHASSSRGVVISNLSGPYFESTYHSSGRVNQYHAMLGRKTAPKATTPKTTTPKTTTPKVSTPEQYRKAPSISLDRLTKTSQEQADSILITDFFD